MIFTSVELLDALRRKVPDLQVRGLKRFLENLAEEEDGFAPYVDFHPDAWRWLSDERVLDLYEIETSHFLDVRKLEKLASFWFSADCEDIGARLSVIDRYGNCCTLNLMEAFYRYCLNPPAMEVPQ